MSAEAAIIRINVERDVNGGIGVVQAPAAACSEMPVPYSFYAMKELGFTHLPLIDGGHQALWVFVAQADAGLNTQVGGGADGRP